MLHLESGVLFNPIQNIPITGQDGLHHISINYINNMPLYHNNHRHTKIQKIPMLNPESNHIMLRAG